MRAVGQCAKPVDQAVGKTAQRRAEAQTSPSTNGSVGGYLAVWTAFSAVMTLPQRGLLELQLVTPMMESSTDWLSGTLLVAAGAFASTPFKHACLNKRRTPLRFRMSEWRPGSERRLRHGSAPRCLLHRPSCARLMLLFVQARSGMLGTDSWGYLRV